MSVLDKFIRETVFLELLETFSASTALDFIDCGIIYLSSINIVIVPQYSFISAYLHSKSIPHRGLRCASIYIDDKGSIKIGNTQNNPSKYRSAEEAAGCDNFRWLSPEARAGRVQSTESDMWSLGCTVIELLTGSPPVYDGVEQNEFQSLKGEIVARAVDRHDVSPRQVQLLLVEIVQHCLVSEKKERKSAAEV